MGFWDDMILYISNFQTNVDTWISEQTQSITAKLTSGFNSVCHLLETLVYGTDGLPDANRFQDDVIAQETQIDDMISDMDTAPTVNVDDAVDQVGQITDIYSYTDGTYYDLLSSMIVENTSLQTMITFSFLFATIGFLLYGKKG